MTGTPAGWYDDPEQPGQQRYWDGNAWTEHRAPGAQGAPTPPPAPAVPTPPPAAPAVAAPMAPPVGAPPAKKSHKGVWIALAVLGLFVFLIVAALALVALLGKNEDATSAVESNLRSGLQSDFASKGLDLNVTSLDCQDVKQKNGPFTTTCTMSVAGLTPTVPVSVTGTIDGSSVSAKGQTTVNLLDSALAVKAVQPIVDSIASSVTVLSCTLPQPLVLVDDTLTFTCQTDSDETATFSVENGKLVLSDVQ